MNPGVQEALIWAAAVLIPVLLTLRYLARPVRRAIDAWTGEHTVTAAEREAATQARLADTEERRAALELRRATLAERAETERARLAAETAQYRTDAVAAEAAVDAATDGRRQVLAARAQAEADLLPEITRANASGSRAEEMQALATAYAAYCDVTGPNALAFGNWAGDFAGYPA